jgi:hypothetical protein
MDQVAGTDEYTRELLMDPFLVQFDHVKKLAPDLAKLEAKPQLLQIPAWELRSGITTNTLSRADKHNHDPQDELP